MKSVVVPTDYIIWPGGSLPLLQDHGWVPACNSEVRGEENKDSILDHPHPLNWERATSSPISSSERAVQCSFCSSCRPPDYCTTPRWSHSRRLLYRCRNTPFCIIGYHTLSTMLFAPCYALGNLGSFMMSLYIYSSTNTCTSFDFQRCLLLTCVGSLLLAIYGAQTLRLLIRLHRSIAPAVCDVYMIPAGLHAALSSTSHEGFMHWR